MITIEEFVVALSGVLILVCLVAGVILVFAFFVLTIKALINDLRDLFYGRRE